MPGEFLIGQRHTEPMARNPNVSLQTEQEIRGTFQNANSNNSYGRSHGQINKHANGTPVTYSQGTQPRSTTQNIKVAVVKKDAYKLHSAGVNETNPINTCRARGQNGDSHYIIATQQKTIAPTSSSFVPVTASVGFKVPGAPVHSQAKTATKTAKRKPAQNQTTFSRSDCMMTKEFVEYIQSPRVLDRFDEEEDQEEVKRFWVCDAEVFKKDQESRKVNGQQSCAANVQTQDTNGTRSTLLPMKTIAGAHAGGDTVVQTATVAVSTNRGTSAAAFKSVAVAASAATTSQKHGIGQFGVPIIVRHQVPKKVNPGPRHIVTNAGGTQVSPKSSQVIHTNMGNLGLAQKPFFVNGSQPSVESMPTIVSCYSLKSNTATNKPEPSTLKELKSTWKRTVPPTSEKIVTIPASRIVTDSKQQRIPKSTSDRYDHTITKTIEKAKREYGDNHGDEDEAGPSHPVKQPKRPCSVSPSTSLKTSRERPRNKSTGRASKSITPKRNARMSVQVTEKPVPSPSSSLESWFSSKQTTSLDMHVVGNYPSPIIISKKPVFKASALLVSASNSALAESKSISVPTSCANTKHSSSISASFPGGAALFRKEVSVKTPSGASNSKTVGNLSQSRLQTVLGEVQILSRSQTSISQPPTQQRNTRALSDATLEQDGQTRSTCVEAPQSFSGTGNELLEKSDEVDACPEEPDVETPEEPLDYSMATLKKLEMGCFSPEQEFALDLSVPRNTTVVSPEQLSNENVAQSSESSISRVPESIAAIAFGNWTPTAIPVTEIVPPSGPVLPSPAAPKIGMSSLDTLCSVALSSYEEKTLEPKKSSKPIRMPKKKDKGAEKRRPRKKRPNPVKKLIPHQSADTTASGVTGHGLQDSKTKPSEKESESNFSEKDIGCYLELTRRGVGDNATETADAANEQENCEKNRDDLIHSKDLESVASLPVKMKSPVGSSPELEAGTPKAVTVGKPSVKVAPSPEQAESNNVKEDNAGAESEISSILCPTEKHNTKEEAMNCEPSVVGSKLNSVSDDAINILTKDGRQNETEDTQVNKKIRMGESIPNAHPHMHVSDGPVTNSAEMTETPSKSPTQEGKEPDKSFTDGGATDENSCTTVEKAVCNEHPTTSTATVKGTSGGKTGQCESAPEVSDKEVSMIPSKEFGATGQKNSLVDDISQGRNSPNVTLLRLNSDEMRTNFSVTSEENQVINIRPESLKTIIRVKVPQSKVSAGRMPKIDDVMRENMVERTEYSVGQGYEKDETGNKIRQPATASSETSVEVARDITDMDQRTSVSEAIMQQEAPIPDETDNCINVEVPAVVHKDLEVTSPHNHSDVPHEATEEAVQINMLPKSKQQKTRSKVQDNTCTEDHSQNVSDDKTPPVQNEERGLSENSKVEPEVDETEGLFFGVRTPPRKQFNREKSLSESQEMLEMNEACCDEYDNMFLTENESEEERDKQDDVKNTKDGSYELKKSTEGEDGNIDAATANSVDAIDEKMANNENVTLGEDTPDMESDSTKDGTGANESSIDKLSLEQETGAPPPDDKSTTEENPEADLVAPSDREKLGEKTTKIVPVEVKEEWTDQSSTTSSVSSMLLKSPISTNKKFGYGSSSTPVRRIGYNFHADFSGCDIKIKRRKLVKKEDKSAEKKGAKELPSPKSSSLTYVLLSDSSDSSDETDFIRTKVPERRLKKRRKPVRLSIPTVQEEREPEGDSHSSDAVSKDKEDSAAVVPEKQHITSVNEVTENKTVEPEKLQLNCSTALRRSSRKRRVPSSRTTSAGAAKVQRAVKSTASKKEVSAIQKVAGAIKSKYNKATKKAVPLKRGRSKTNSAAPKPLPGPKTNSRTSEVLPVPNSEEFEAFSNPETSLEASIARSDPKTNSEASRAHPGQEAKAEARKATSSFIKKSVSQMENSPAQSTSGNAYTAPRSRFHLSPSPYEVPSIHLNQSPPNSEDSDVPTPNIIRLKSFVRDPYSPECGEFGDNTGDHPTTGSSSTVDKNVAKKKRSDVTTWEKVPKRKPKFQILKLNTVKGFQTHTSSGQKQQKRNLKKNQGGGVFKPTEKPDARDSFGNVSLKDVVDEIIRSSPAQPKTSVMQSSPIRYKKPKLPKQARPRVSQPSSPPLFNLKSYAVKHNEQVHKNTARMKGSWKTTKLNDVTKISTPPLTYLQPEKFSKAKRDENIYLTMQKLLNMGLIMDQMPRKELPAVGWKSSFDMLGREHGDTRALAANDYVRSSELPKIPDIPPLFAPAILERQHPAIKKEPAWFAPIDVQVKPCSVILKRLALPHHEAFC